MVINNIYLKHYTLITNKYSTLDMIDLGLFFEKSLTQNFDRVKLHKKGYRNIYFFYLRKFSRF